jgi:hypothetical protein
MDFMESVFSQAGRGDWLKHHLHSRPSPDCHLCKFVAPMEAGPQRADGLEGRDPGEAALLRTCQKQAASKPLKDDEMDLGNEGFPWSTEDTEERNGR